MTRKKRNIQYISEGNKIIYVGFINKDGFMTIFTSTKSMIEDQEFCSTLEKECPQMLSSIRYLANDDDLRYSNTDLNETGKKLLINIEYDYKNSPVKFQYYKG